MLAVVEENGATWRGVTVYSPGYPTSPGKQMRNMTSQARTGVLVWRREVK